MEDIIARTEQTARRLNEKNGQTLREGVQCSLREAKTPEPTLTRTERKALKELKDLSRRKGLKILPADKGNATVMMDSTQYASKLGDLLAEDSYRLLPRNPTARIEKWVTDALKSVERDGNLPQQARKKLIPRQSSVPQCLWFTQDP